PVGACEGIPLYQYFPRQWDRPGSPPGKPPAGGPAFAMLPDALLIGSADAVKDVIRRAKGKDNSPSLAGVAAFQEAGKGFGNQPGLSAFEALPAFLEKMEPIVNDGPGRNVWPVIKSAVNPKAFRSVTAGLTLEKGTLRYRLVARLNAGEKSPVLELLPTTPVP